MTSFTPSFEIDEKGRSICQAHSNYLKFINPDKDYFEELLIDSQLTCLSCDHFINDECSFSRSELEIIEGKRNRHFFNPYRCKLCGNKIHIMFTVVNKLYQEKIIPNLEIPLICCNCFESLQNKEFKRHILKRSLSSIEVQLLAFFFIFLGIYSYNITGSIPFIIIPLILAISMSIFGIIRLRTIYFAIKGWRYYKKFLKNK